MANTRSKRPAPTPSLSTASWTAKRRQGRAALAQQTAAASNEEERNPIQEATASTSQAQSQSSPNPRSNTMSHNLELPDLNLSNYESAMDYWPINQINQVLASQTGENERLCAVFIGHAQAVMERFEHTLHMIAMIAGCSVAVLKKRLRVQFSISFVCAFFSCSCLISIL